MVANQKIVTAINEQIGNEFNAMLQYYAIAAHFGAEALPELSTHFYKQAEEEKGHALRFIQFVIDTGARVEIPAAEQGPILSDGTLGVNSRAMNRKRAGGGGVC